MEYQGIKDPTKPSPDVDRKLCTGPIDCDSGVDHVVHNTHAHSALAVAAQASRNSAAITEPVVSLCPPRRSQFASRYVSVSGMETSR